MRLIEKVQQVIAAHTKVNDRFLLAVSGGKDSMVLFHVFTELGLDFVVAHMNYGLRETAASLDEKLVEKVASDREIPFFAKSVDTKTFCRENGFATQEGARILRYDWFEHLLKEKSFDWIVTAHHEEDNKETFIQNLKRGSGLRGLKAMQLIQNNRFKPMLNCSREEIDSYAEEQNVIYRKDASNNQNHYQRNLVRNKVLPELEKELKGIGKGISSSIANLQLDYDYLHQTMEQETKRLLLKENDDWRIPNYKSLHVRLLFHILERHGFNFQQVEDLLRSKSSGKRLMNDQFAVYDSFGDLYITQVADKEIIQFNIEQPGEYAIGDALIRITPSSYPASFEVDNTIVYIDADTIDWPLEVRSYQHGDKIKPLGMNGSKKLSDFFTDIKMPVPERSRQKVLLSRGEIIWVVGELLSDSVKLTNHTKKVLKIETIR
ncbi:tRNA lysidine(34) synthetase TilS [Parvicella tangerina]|uniref:tRNA(Ile)-lysidine synthase n=1 Tax=Parvicella tangerina TaxID=2829795 RepID=A0A916JKZ6_9FLAO|nr:tRNA lysidine(34) synthetase TilS [Parvicella tangerina]CAG5076824.1 tRNA(Ile)-lysidine synthase [Parvicella tangerina]